MLSYTVRPSPPTAPASARFKFARRTCFTGRACCHRAATTAAPRDCRGSLTRGARAPLGHRQTVKVARIKDPKLGALHYSFMFLILVYIIIYKACWRPRPPLAADL